MPVYLVLQARGRYPECVATNSRELLPRVFTLTLSGGCFLLPLAKDYSLLRFPQTGALSCADFPQRSAPEMTGAQEHDAATDRPTILWLQIYIKILTFVS